MAGPQLHTCRQPALPGFKIMPRGGSSVACTSASQSIALISVMHPCTLHAPKTQRSSRLPLSTMYASEQPASVARKGRAKDAVRNYLWDTKMGNNLWDLEHFCPPQKDPLLV